MAKKIIEIRELSYRYPDGNQALQDINLEVCEGESVGIIGPNGAGKSTLLLHLNGILGENGKVRVLGNTTEEKNLSFIRSKVALVFQDPDNQLFMPTVFDDVAFGPINMRKSSQEVNSLVNKALSDVDMSNSINRSSHHLSFGEKKRVSLATVLSMNPEVLVLDEPSSNLDPKSRRELIVLLSKFDVTKIIASHDLELIRETCTKVVVLYDGKIVTQGPTAEILSNKSLMESYALEVPFSLRRHE